MNEIINKHYKNNGEEWKEKTIAELFLDTYDKYEEGVEYRNLKAWGGRRRKTRRKKTKKRRKKKTIRKNKKEK